MQPTIHADVMMVAADNCYLSNFYYRHYIGWSKNDFKSYKLVC